MGFCTHMQRQAATPGNGTFRQGGGVWVVGIFQTKEPGLVEKRSHNLIEGTLFTGVHGAIFNAKQ